jgi:hypothetical protein
MEHVIKMTEPLGGKKFDRVIKVTDNGGKTIDRYTAYFESKYMLMMSPNPQSPQGVCLSDTWKQDYIDNDEGKEVEFDDLPERVQKAITDFIFED